MEKKTIIEGEVVKNELVVKKENQIDIVREEIGMAKMWEMAEKLALSTIVPMSYQNRPENCYIAIDMANRMGLAPLVVMQNLYVIQGKPSFSGSAIASMIRSNPSFRNVELHYVGEEGNDNWGAYITATNIHSGKELKGATVTIGTSKAEGWYQKSGSKWKTMPELMLSYRAYAWFGRVHCPELLMGLQTSEEIYDSNEPVETKVVNPYEKGE